MFFRNKRRPNDVEGYDRISRGADDSGEGDDDLFEEDTVLLTRDVAQAPPAGRGRDSFALVDESVEESVTVVRAPERPAAREAQPTVSPATVTPTPLTPTPAPVPPASAGMAAQGYESPRMALPDTSIGAGQAGAVSLVAKEATWEGKLVTSGNVRIEGALVGEIETQATLFVAAEARVDGAVRARNVTLAGEIKGELHCQEKLEILPGGAARGEVNTGTLVVHEGAFIDSRFQMHSAAAG